MTSPMPSNRPLHFLEKWGIVLAVLPIYLSGLERWPLWEAEIWTYHTAMSPVPEVIRQVAMDKHPPLFFLLEWLLLRIHPTDAVARMPAVFAALAAIVLLQRVVTRHFGRLQGWFAGLLLALSPYTAAYAGTARSGTATILLGILTLGFGLDLVAGPRPRRAAVGLGLSLLVGLYVHYDMGLALVAAALGGIGGLLLDDRPRAERLQRLWMGVAALVLPVLAFLPWVFGPMAEQHVEGNGESQARSLGVFRYLLWPVGPDHIPPGAVVLLLLAAVGLLGLIRRNAQSGTVAGWVAVGVIVPYLWSVSPGTMGKFYLYAPLQGVFLLLVAIGITVGTRLLGRMLPTGLAPVLVSVVVVGLSARPLYDVLIPRGNLVSVVMVMPGVWDSRMDAYALATAPVAHRRLVQPVSGGGQALLHYAPSLDPRPPSPTKLPPGVWKATPRLTARQKIQGLWVDPGEGCLFDHAFYDSLLISQPEDCPPVLAHISALGDELQYGPFMMETAVQAARRKDWERAEQYARKASQLEPVTARADVLLAGILIDTNKAEEALEVIETGLDKAARYRHREEWLELAQLKVETGVALRDRRKIDEAERFRSCLQTRLYTFSETWCQHGIWGLL